MHPSTQGILVIGTAVKILGPDLHGQDLLIIAKYLQIKRFELRLASPPPPPHLTH